MRECGNAEGKPESNRKVRTTIYLYSQIQSGRVAGGVLRALLRLEGAVTPRWRKAVLSACGVLCGVEFEAS